MYYDIMQFFPLKKKKEKENYGLAKKPRVFILALSLEWLVQSGLDQFNNYNQIMILLPNLNNC